MSEALTRTRFSVPKMDCAAEERLVRLALGNSQHVKHVDVDLSTREVSVFHDGDPATIRSVLDGLKLGAVLQDGAAASAAPPAAPSTADEARTLKIVLAINAGMFVAEGVGAYLADSSALLADSLDMFADAAVYGIALYGASTIAAQTRAARYSGILQFALALVALAEVLRRAVGGSEPEAPLMVGVAAAALVANVSSMWLLARHRGGGAHMKASWIFTTNDVIANVGVIVAAVLVGVTSSAMPDLVVGTAIGLVVLSGAIRIIRLPQATGR